MTPLPLFYYSPLSPNARRVWLALLEKGIEFTPVVLQLNGDQRSESFLALNPFHQVPVWVDGSLRIIESMAILDYLEVRYPEPALLPRDPADFARVRMVQMLVDNKLFKPATTLLTESPQSLNYAQAEIKLAEVLGFLEELLTGLEYFGGDRLSSGDITLGTALHLLPASIPWLESYPWLHQWWQRIQARPRWQQTCLTDEEIRYFQRRVKLIVKLGQRQMLRS
ncbi:MAG: glutathione S-transferase family protein [Prochlorothrix sp.]|nr:glutathione S-transferase family protein [Prochlorothrix sp.]